MTNQFKAPPELEDENWKGNIRGAINLALMTVLNTLYGIEDESPEAEAAFADKVALHVLDSDAEYIKWREKILKKLEKTYRRDEQDPLGMKIPREIINPNLDIPIEEHKVLIESFLSKIDIQVNPFLIPYDIEAK
ncbi:MAG: hypothetical protein HC877_22650 [Thioploca sp.]|nr:hypothetical protein [Thioploca sp.]